MKIIPLSVALGLCLGLISCVSAQRGSPDATGHVRIGNDTTRFTLDAQHGCRLVSIQHLPSGTEF